MEYVTALEDKFKTIKNKLWEQPTFYMDDVQAIFPDMKKSSLYWNLSKLVEEGYLKRVRRGIYAFNEWKGAPKISLPAVAERIQKIMDEKGFEYYISGTDVLMKYMQHVPEQYPVILFIEKAAHDDIASGLRAEGYEVTEPTKLKQQYEDAILSGNEKTQIIIYDTDNFEYCNDGTATIEKAFIDLYFSITRNGYPIAVQELVRVYQNLSRLGNIDKKKMVTAAARRNIQYDIRFIVESKHITDDAMKFVGILRREEQDGLRKIIS